MPSGAEVDPVLTVRQPDDRRVEQWLRRESGALLTYPEGLSRTTPPPRWFVDEVSAEVGAGAEAFAAATAAVAAWEHFDLPWFRVHRPAATPFAVGTTVAYSARVFGLWWTYACRVVEVVDETDGDGTRRFGFAYGTIGSHAERGEERFVVHLDARTGLVTGSVLAVSRPGRWFTWVGLPLARRVQHRFKPEVLAALAGAVRRRCQGC